MIEAELVSVDVENPGCDPVVLLEEFLFWRDNYTSHSFHGNPPTNSYEFTLMDVSGWIRWRVNDYSIEYNGLAVNWGVLLLRVWEDSGLISCTHRGSVPSGWDKFCKSQDQARLFKLNELIAEAEAAM